MSDIKEFSLNPREFFPKSPIPIKLPKSEKLIVFIIKKIINLYHKK